jgi:hypothetical protein
MFVYRVRLPGQMFAQVVRRAPQMFAWAVAILRDKYREIGHLIGECNREIDQIRAKVHRELPINTSKRPQNRVFGPKMACFPCFSVLESVYFAQLSAFACTP